MYILSTTAEEEGVKVTIILASKVTSGPINSRNPFRLIQRCCFFFIEQTAVAFAFLISPADERPTSPHKGQDCACKGYEPAGPCGSSARRTEENLSPGSDQENAPQTPEWQRDAQSGVQMDESLPCVGRFKDVTETTNQEGVHTGKRQNSHSVCREKLLPEPRPAPQSESRHRRKATERA